MVSPSQLRCWWQHSVTYPISDIPKVRGRVIGGGDPENLGKEEKKHLSDSCVVFCSTSFTAFTSIRLPRLV